MGAKQSAQTSVVGTTRLVSSSPPSSGQQQFVVESASASATAVVINDNNDSNHNALLEPPMAPSGAPSQGARPRTRSVDSVPPPAASSTSGGAVENGHPGISAAAAQGPGIPFPIHVPPVVTSSRPNTSSVLLGPSEDVGAFVGNAAVVNSPSASDSSTTTPEQINLPVVPGRVFHHAQSLPVHLLSLPGIKCPVCSKFVLPDEIECHLIMCLTKPRISYNEDVLSSSAGECVICFEDMECGDHIARLPCLCIYHKSCIDKWFEVNRSCPEHPND